ncbi:MAG: menaquinone-dependent protoporphyrinogen IX dehydrogenase [Pseudomonadota bacterium]|nr:menaquinone-dependent protoporphyrinogen IX dehydrogenase [Pseudomonadota bacterium]
MAKLLIVYATTEGQTAKIARRIAETAGARGHAVETRSARDLPRRFSLETFDAVIVGASLHYGKYQKDIQNFVGRHLDALKGRPSAFFSVSGAAAGKENGRQAAEDLARKFLRGAGWQPDQMASFAGAIVYTQYGFFKRLLMKRVVGSAGGPTDTSRDHEFTDWEAVARFAEGFLARLD